MSIGALRGSDLLTENPVIPFPWKVLAFLLPLFLTPALAVNFESKGKEIIGIPHDVVGVTTFRIGDIDKDGYNDIALVEGSNASQRNLAWFRNAGGTWTRHNIAASVPGPVNKNGESYTGDSQLADINGDGWLDIVFPVSSQNYDTSFKKVLVYWYENPAGQAGGKATSPWVAHSVGSYTGFLAGEIMVDDLDGDFLTDIVIRSLVKKSGKSLVVIYFQNADGTWDQRVIETERREGLTLGDVNGDGRPDIILNGFYLLTPTNARNGNFNRVNFDSAHYSLPDGDLNNTTKTALAEMSGDSRIDMMVTTAEGRLENQSGASERAKYKMSWYKALPGDNWEEYPIETEITNNHQALVADLDLDGDLDIAGGFVFSASPKEVFVYLNDQGDGTRWSRQVIAEKVDIMTKANSTAHQGTKAAGLYSGMLADLDIDGDLDIVGPRRFSSTKPYGTGVFLYENQTVVTAPAKPGSHPTGLTAREPDPGVVLLEWKDAVVNDTLVEIQRQNGTGSFSTLVTLSSYGLDHYADRSVHNGTVYTYRARFANNIGTSSQWSNQAVILTSGNGGGQPPVAPNDLAVAGPVVSGSIHLQWTDAASNETSYEVQRRKGAPGSWEETQWASLISNLPANTQAYTDNDSLPAGDKYSYRVVVHNDAGNAVSNVASITVPGTGTPSDPPAPADFAITEPAISGSVHLHWTDLAVDENRYVVMRRKGAKGDWTKIATLPPDTEAYVDSDNLTVGVSYTYKVKVYNSVGKAVSGKATAKIVAP